jgi:hypothetical protein
VAAKKALRIGLTTEVEVYADDEHINAISRAELALLRDLENKPLACVRHFYSRAEWPLNCCKRSRTTRLCGLRNARP